MKSFSLKLFITMMMLGYLSLGVLSCNSADAAADTSNQQYYPNEDEPAYGVWDYNYRMVDQSTGLTYVQSLSRGYRAGDIVLVLLPTEKASGFGQLHYHRAVITEVVY